MAIDNVTNVLTDIEAALDAAMGNCCRESREREQRLIEARVNAGPTVEISVETYEKLKQAARLHRMGDLSPTENRHPRLIRIG